MRVVAVTGEASGDLIAADALARFKAAHPAAELAGIGGKRLSDIGMDCWFTSDDLAVRGYVEALSKLVHILSVRYWLCEYIDKWKPGLYLGVDAPDFNLGVEARLRAKGIRTVHLSPSIWAWRGERIRGIGRAADRVLALFPMEPPLYEKAGIPVSFVGHPLATRLPMCPDTTGARRALRIEARCTPLFTLMPGSRMAEVEHLGVLFIRTAERLLVNHPQAHFLVPLATRPTFDRFEHLLRTHAAHPERFQIMFGHAHQALEACDVALIASGTATLEAALLKKPMVISYRMPWLSYKLMYKRGYLPWVGLPNILAGREVVPELLQHAATEESLAAALEIQLNNPAASEQRAAFEEMHNALRADTAAAIVDAVAPFLNHGGS